ncbi:hypothetical protein U1Q18_040110, partial [Sarracenia purpurea var. burkii]
MTMEEFTSLLIAEPIHVESMINKVSNNSSELSVAYNAMRSNQNFRQNYINKEVIILTEEIIEDETIAIEAGVSLE